MWGDLFGGEMKRGGNPFCHTGTGALMSMLTAAQGLGNKNGYLYMAKCVILVNKKQKREKLSNNDIFVITLNHF